MNELLDLYVKQAMTRHLALTHGQLGFSSLTNSIVEDLSFPGGLVRIVQI